MAENGTGTVIRLALVALLLCGCAAGVETVRADGACEVRGIAFGRAAIAAYRPGGAIERDQEAAKTGELEEDVCVRLTGGQSTSTFVDALSAAVGVVFGYLAAL